MKCVDFIFALLRQPVKREKSDQHAALLQMTITALGMDYSMPKRLLSAEEDVFQEADIFVLPTLIKVQRLIALGELLSRVDLARLDFRAIAKFSGLASALAIVAVSRLGSSALSVVYGFSTKKAYNRACKIPKARTKLLKAIADIAQIAHELKPLPISRFFSCRRKWVI